LRAKFAGDRGSDAWRLPGGLLVPIAAGLVTLALAASAEAKHLIAAGVALLAGAVVYRFRRAVSEPGEPGEPAEPSESAETST